MWENGSNGVFVQLDYKKYKHPETGGGLLTNTSTNLVGQSLTTGTSRTQIGSISCNMNDAMSFTN